MLGSYFEHFLDKPLSSLAKKTYISPNALTITGFITTIIAAVTLPYNLFWGGIFILAGGFFDVFDGIVARVNNKQTDFGAFLDSVLDRYSDSFLFIGLACYFFINGSMTGIALAIGTMIGALLISYARARAEGLGRECNVGLMERPERIILMTFGALTGWIMPVMWIMFILTHATVIQRIYHAWKIMQKT
jgi:phosphatidylglycerophosphate synthase